MSRRELAGRAHILDHETGKGQHAFKPRRRDMNVYRAEQEKYRVDQKAEEVRQREEDREAYQTADAAAAIAAGTPTLPEPITVVPVITTAPGIAGLRISMPRINQPGARVPFGRPTAPLPTPKSIAAAAAAASILDGLTLSSTAEPVDTIAKSPPKSTAPVFKSSAPEPPLLPSHLCSSYFVEPLSWMGPMLDSGILAGKITCPNLKCGAKLGSYDWAGSRTYSDVHNRYSADVHDTRMLVWSVGVSRIRTRSSKSRRNCLGRPKQWMSNSLKYRLV